MAINRVRKGMPKPPTPPEPEMDETEIPYLILEEDNVNMVSAEVLGEEGIAIYLKSHAFNATAVTNLAAANKTPLDIVRGEKGYFLVCDKRDAGDLVKALLEQSLGTAEERRD